MEGRGQVDCTVAEPLGKNRRTDWTAGSGGPSHGLDRFWQDNVYCPCRNL